jgi:hypothetical protein
VRKKNEVNEVNEVSFVLTRFFPRCGKAAAAEHTSFLQFYSTFVYF